MLYLKRGNRLNYLFLKTKTREKLMEVTKVQQPTLKVSSYWLWIFLPICDWLILIVLEQSIDVVRKQDETKEWGEAFYQLALYTKRCFLSS